MRAITTAAFWRKSSHLTPGTPTLCNLPSHSALPQCDCSRNEKAILERAVPSVVSRGPRCQSLAGVIGGQENYDYAVASFGGGDVEPAASVMIPLQRAGVRSVH